MWQSPELQNFNPNEWRFHGYWKQDLLPAYFWQSCFDLVLAENLSLPIQEIGYLIFKEGHYLASQHVYDQIKQSVEESVKEKDFRLWKTLESGSRKVHEQISAITKEPILPLTPENWQKLIELGNANTFYWAIAAAYLCPIADELLQETVAKEGLNTSDFSALIPTIETPLLTQRDELLAFKREFYQSHLTITIDSLDHLPDFKHRIEAHCQQYAWIEFASWIGKPLSLERLLERIASADDATQPVINRDSYSDSLKNALDLFKIAGYLRQASGEYFMQLSFHYFEPLQKYSQIIGLEYKYTLKLSPIEILQSLQGNLAVIDLRQKIAERQNGNWITFTHDARSIIVTDPQDVQTMFDLMVPKDNAQTDSIKGQIGNRGYAKGKVRVVMNTEDFASFQPGEILVSSMTTPDFVLLMQQAAAIVTDQGGLLCHAAIVSRELNKPCVIGTKNATFVFKNGDYVEVDATTGIISKLKV